MTRVVDITEEKIEITIGGILTNVNQAHNITVAPYPGLEGTSLQEVLENLADESFNQAGTPDPNVVQEGDTWYNTADNSIYLYREISPGVLDWVPFIVGNIAPSSDVVDAGAF